MASTTMHRHLTYVAMTRHRDAVGLYAGRDELKDLEALSMSLGRAGRQGDDARLHACLCRTAWAGRRHYCQERSWTLLPTGLTIGRRLTTALWGSAFARRPFGSPWKPRPGPTAVRGVWVRNSGCRWMKGKRSKPFRNRFRMAGNSAFDLAAYRPRRKILGTWAWPEDEGSGRWWTQEKPRQIAPAGSSFPQSSSAYPRSQNSTARSPSSS